jgi:hypothetical protein
MFINNITHPRREVIDNNPSGETIMPKREVIDRTITPMRD